MNRPRTHLLKLWPDNFDAIASGKKTADVRSVEDRTFTVGDEVVFRRWDPSLEMDGAPGKLAPVPVFDDVDPAIHVEALTSIKGMPDWMVCRVTHVEELAGELHLFGITLAMGHRFGKLTKIAVLSLERLA